MIDDYAKFVDHTTSMESKDYIALVDRLWAIEDTANLPRLLTAVIAINVLPSQERAREDKAKADIRLLEQALELYRLDMISYPNSREGLQALVTVPENHRFKERYRSGGYVRRLEKDPWGNDYKYRRPGRFGTFDLYSLGADGEEGGEGSDKDIGNWE